MASVVSSADEEIVGINVTPLVDVVLVLLVIFMIAAPAIYQAAIKVDLPKAATGEKADHVTLRFTLLANNQAMMGNEAVAREKVPSLVQRALQIDPMANAMVAADKALAHGAVMGFVDLVKSAGIERIALAVDSPGAK